MSTTFESPKDSPDSVGPIDIRSLDVPISKLNEPRVSPRPMVEPLPVSIRKSPTLISSDRILPVNIDTSRVSPRIIPLTTRETSTVIRPSPTQRIIPPVVPRPIVRPIIQSSAAQRTIVPRVDRPMISPISPVQLKQPLAVTSTPVSPSDINFTLPGTRDQTIEKKVADLGFAPIKKTLVKRPNGQIEANYIKVTDKNGYQSYIKLNVDANVMVRPEDLTTIESVDASNIPYSIRISALDKVGLDVSGVAYECDKGICVLNKGNPDSKASETFLSYIEKPIKSNIVEAEMPVPYPVVRLSDVLENPTLVMRNIEKSSINIRAEMAASYVKHLNEMVTINSEEFKGLDLSMKASGIAMNQIMGSLVSLEKLRRVYDFNPPTTLEQKQKYDKVVDNIRIRYDKLNQLLRITNEAIRQYKQAKAQLIEGYKGLISELDSQFLGIDKTIY